MTSPPLLDGTYDIYFYESYSVIDARFPGGLIIDTVKPEVTVTAPELKAGDYSPAITGTVDDENAAITVTINGKTYTATNNKNGTWVLGAGTIDNLSPGTYDITITTTDTAGNVTTTTTKVTVLGVVTTTDENGLSHTGTGVEAYIGVSILPVTLAGAVFTKRAFARKPVDFS